MYKTMDGWMDGWIEWSFSSQNNNLFYFSTDLPCLVPLPSVGPHLGPLVQVDAPSQDPLPLEHLLCHPDLEPLLTPSAAPCPKSPLVPIAAHPVSQGESEKKYLLEKIYSENIYK